MRARGQPYWIGARYILELARRDGRVSVEALSQAASCVSPHTISRDINLLCEEAKLRRLHGGAEFIGDSASTCRIRPAPS
jgi:DeoR family glycerol-3-phosphate regulon repressor